MEENKSNSYIEYIDMFAEKYSHKNNDDWKDLEEYFDYVLNDYFLPNGEHVRQEVWDFKYWVEATERGSEAICGQLCLQDTFIELISIRENEALFLVYGKGRKEKVPEPDELDKEFRAKLFAICRETEKRIDEELIGTFAGGNFEIKGKIPNFTVGLGCVEYFWTSEIEFEDVKRVLQTEPERHGRKLCYLEKGLCEIWMDSKTGILEGIYEFLPSQSQKAVLKLSQRDFLKKHIRNFDEKVETESANSLLHEISSLIHSKGMNWKRDGRNMLGDSLTETRMSIFLKTVGCERAVKELVEMRNRIFSGGAALLDDPKLVERFYEEQGLLDFEEQVAEKMDIKGLSREDAIWEIHRKYYKK